MYRNVLEFVRRKHLDIATIFITLLLLLLQSPNCRCRCCNRRAAEQYNHEACRINTVLRGHCHRSQNVRYIDHGMVWLPLAKGGAMSVRSEQTRLNRL